MTEQRRHSGALDLAGHQRPFVSVAALADYLDTERRTIIRMIATGALQGVKVGREWRVTTESARQAFHVQHHDPQRPL
jgi:excisionase family DNA binding protein